MNKISTNEQRDINGGGYLYDLFWDRWLGDPNTNVPRVLTHGVDDDLVREVWG